MDIDARRVVAAGYDRMGGGAYLELVDSSGGDGIRKRYLDALFERLPERARVLDLGCGAGHPMTAALTERFRTVGLELSAGQLALARLFAPAAGFVRGDMTLLPFRDEAFAAVAAFYSMTHVPRAEHSRLLADVRRVLRPAGLAVLTLGSSDHRDAVYDFCGAPMFFSHFDGETSTRLVAGSGFDVLEARDETGDEDGVAVTFRWVVARRAE